MTRATRVLLTILLCGSLLVATTVGVSAAAVYRAGSIAVEVHEGRGQHLHIAIPAGLASIAIWLTPDSVFEPAMLDEVRPLLPALRAGWRELSGTPDCVLAEVRDHDERVIVAKQGGAILIDVESGDSTVRVALPLGAVGPLLAKLERVGRDRA